MRAFPAALEEMLHVGVLGKSLATARVRLLATKGIDGQDEHIMDELGGAKTRYVAPVVRLARRGGQVLKDGVCKDGGPGDLEYLVVRAGQVREGAAVLPGERLQVPNDALHGQVEHGVAGHGKETPICKLQVARPVDPAVMALAVVLDANDGIDARGQLRSDPVVNGLERVGVDVAVDAAVAKQDEVANEVGAQDGVAQLEVDVAGSGAAKALLDVAARAVVG